MVTEYLLLQAVSLIIIKLHRFFNVNNKSKYYSSGGLWKQGRKFRHNVACFHDTQRRTSGKVKVPATFAVWKNNFIHIRPIKISDEKNIYFQSESLK